MKNKEEKYFWIMVIVDILMGIAAASKIIMGGRAKGNSLEI